MPSINWKKTSFDDELSEFKRTTEEYTPEQGSARKKAIESNLQYLKQQYNKSNPIMLTDQIWKSLGNTDSWGIKNLSDVNDRILKNSKTSGMRDATSVVMEYMSGSVRAPIVLQTGDGYILIAGNTRLMVAKALGISPKCVIIKTDW